MNNDFSPIASQDPRPELPNQSGAWRAIREVIQTILLVAAIYTLVNLAIPRYMVEGRSMQPSFEGDGNERVIVSRIEYFLSDPQRGDIVVLHNPHGSDYYIKRIIGLPGETVTMNEGQVAINGGLLDEPYVMALCSRRSCDERTWVLGEDEYFVLGDNRNNSHDSTAFGAVPRSLIIGRAWIRYWPPQAIDVFQHYDYQPD